VKPLFGAAIGTLLLVACREATPAKAPDKPKAELFLLTPLPIVWSESFGIDQPGSPVLKRLEQDYRVTPIDLPSTLPDGALLLAAQPRALPAEELVALDAWVRRGGRMLLLADPLLEWPSQLPLGDKRRPPITFADTGLLNRWGLRLDAPDERGPKFRGGGHFPVVFISPGALLSNSEHCSLSSAGVIAECRIGRGTAIVVSDADWLNLDLVPTDVGRHTNQLSELTDLLSSLNRTP
jgi:ABC-type uncharacterized transport system